ncbi:alpha/beta hydrolase [Hyphococcus flavus]|uniref:Alpha/beta hydrolase n=1 Tax=Hyphococcus flavus TaxID=1866326 RepID=A0AAE9ZIM7_9PROT|nr:alpha/beta hydrolase [Hyphococcus flavus]WDI31686.1 alpha/beta hydrolase [Hyphococcus flavus]
MTATFKSKPIHLLPAKVLRDGAEAVAPDKAPNDIELVKIDEDVKGEWHGCAGSQNDATILYLHGGGYVFGSPKSHRAVTFALARETGSPVFSLDYRMGPEHLFPAAVDDAVAAYRWLLNQGRDPSRLVIGGDSAGGGLAVALLLSIKENSLPMPAGAFLYSPWTDLTVSGESIVANEITDAMFKAEYISGGVKRYLGDGDPKHPLASPLFGDHRGLPSVLTFASTSEVLLDDSIRLHDKLKRAGVASELVLEEGLIHVWPIFAGRFPEAMTAIRKTAEFIRNQIT